MSILISTVYGPELANVSDPIGKLNPNLSPTFLAVPPEVQIIWLAVVLLHVPVMPLPTALPDHM
ncbi:NB-ARC domain-containing protein [Aurantimicrobium minutum]|uniref:NB-ARC domain-containing protein n=1 Tax=Aurantimicrobium minutum TaxID=708131 RepID=A0A173LY48_9MICO|nr:NB-ARC domain-containing protein [Aurantimicrobium minutum]